MSTDTLFNIKSDAAQQDMARVAALASRMGMTLMGQLLDAGSSFEKAAYAAATAYKTFQDVALGICPADATVVVELGPQQRVQAFERMVDARAFAGKLGSPYLGIDIAHVLKLSCLTVKETDCHEPHRTAH